MYTRKLQNACSWSKSVSETYRSFSLWVTQRPVSKIMSYTNKCLYNKPSSVGRSLRKLCWNTSDYYLCLCFIFKLNNWKKIRRIWPVPCWQFPYTEVKGLIMWEGRQVTLLGKLVSDLTENISVYTGSFQGMTESTAHHFFFHWERNFLIKSI